MTAPRFITANDAYSLMPTTFDHVGDSRTSQMFTNATKFGLTGQHWFNQANALAGHRYQIGVNQGLSGKRTDEYLASANLSPCLTSQSGWLVFGMPLVNDIGQAFAGFTNVNSVAVNLSTVATVGVGNIIAAANQALLAGKKVILTEEPGATSLSNTAVTTGTFTASIVSNSFVLTVTAVASGAVYPGATLAGTFVPAGTFIGTQISGAPNGIGTYNVNTNVSIPSETMTCTYTQMQALYEANARLRAYANATTGVYMWSANSVLWNATSSATAIAFKAGCSSDGTHYTQLGGFIAGQAFNSFMSGLVPVFDYSIANINNVNSTNQRQLINNPLFTTLTGGATTTITLSSGTVPSGWTLTSGQASTTATITSSSDPNGYGNDIIIALTSTVADTINFQSNAPATKQYALTDVIQGGLDVSVAAGSSNALVYFSTQNATNTTNSQQYDLYPQNGGNGPTTAYSYRLLSLPVLGTAIGGTQSFLLPATLTVVFSAAGSITITISRAFGQRAFTYSAAGGFVGA